MKKLWFLLIICCICASPIFAAYQWEPGTAPPPAPGGYVLGDSLDSFIQYAYAWLLGAGGLFAFIRLIMAGITWGGAGGNITKVQDAQNIIKNVVMGLAILLFSWLLLNTINPDIINPDIRLPGTSMVITGDLALKGADNPRVANPALTAGVFGSGGIFSKIFSGQSIVETKSNRVAEFDWSNFMFKVLPRKVRNVGAKPGPSGPGTNCSQAPQTKPTPEQITWSPAHDYAFPMSGFFPNVTCSHWDCTKATDISTGATWGSGLLYFRPIAAYTTGTVTYARDVAPPGNPGGKILYIAGDSDGKFYYYAHMCKVYVTSGTHVTVGEVLGVTGNTGLNAGAIEHLHFGVAYNTPVDRLLLVNTGAASICASEDLGSHFGSIQQACAGRFCTATCP